MCIIQTKMSGSSVCMKTAKKLTAAVIEILPQFKCFLTEEVTLCVKLLKALCGFVQSSKLWFKKLTEVLERERYSYFPTDPCRKKWSLMIEFTEFILCQCFAFTCKR